MKCIKVKENYTLYNSVLAEVKFLNGQFIKLVPKNNKNTADIPILCGNREMKLYVVNMPKKEQYNYALKDQYFDKALIRLDTDGPAHINKTMYDLDDYIIPPPHFHKFDPNGDMYAYFPSRFEKIKSEIQNNPHTGLQVFCDESNIECPSNVIIKIGMFNANHFAKDSDNLKFIDNLAI